LEDGVWRTVGGRRIFIKEGQSLTEAMKNSGKFESKKEEKFTEEEIEEIKDDIESFKKGESETFEDMKPEQFKKILEYLGIKKPNVLNKMSRIGYDGTFTTISNVSIRELRPFGEVLRKIKEVKKI
jgi:tRNA G26 N,N-dimethylase Trm1